ncbi:MAG TPA: carboxylating nicotinate-nucleotide diphosphorylase [SAR202 cluster bacterium]|nr:carboxylating nicotinate-nucleotide diphosphorylase [SAR202 cluster bacterium]
MTIPKVSDMQITGDVEAIIDRALAEDLGLGDPTTDILIPQDLEGEAVLVARESGVLAGLDVGLAVFKRVDALLETDAFASDGATVESATRLATVRGRVASILKAERTVVNFIQHLSGIATETRRYVDAAAGHRARIVDTRKTTPGLRQLEKQAVRAGGGVNHRQNLGDGILIKDNHIEAAADQGMSIGDVVKKAKQNASHTIRVEVEVENLGQLQQVLDAGAEIVLLDNMDVELMTRAVEMCRGRAVTEASGGITLETVRDVAATGVDIISVGALTHSVKALDVSLDMVR